MSDGYQPEYQRPLALPRKAVPSAPRKRVFRDHDAPFAVNRVCGLALQAERAQVTDLLTELPLEVAAEVVRRLAQRARERAERILAECGE